MQRWLKRVVYTLVGLAVAAGAAVIIGTQLGERKMHRLIRVAVAPVELPSDSASLERGRYLFMSRGCTECHGVDGAGKTFIDDGDGTLVHSPNITPGNGSVVAKYKITDWVRTIRHGVKPDGRPVRVMPSEDYARFSDEDVAALIAYLRRMQPADGTGAKVQFPFPVMTLYGFGAIKDAAEKIDHTLAPPPHMPEAPTAAYGAYVANACIGCHGRTFTGGRIPGTPPDWPPAADLTPGEGKPMENYTDDRALAALFRSGRRPDGSSVSPVMPFLALNELNDIDVKALFLHLKSLKPVMSD